jgi:hypothetical protein
LPRRPLIDVGMLFVLTDTSKAWADDPRAVEYAEGSSSGMAERNPTQRPANHRLVQSPRAGREANAHARLLAHAATRTCRNLTRRILIDGSEHNATAIACRRGEGEWQITQWREDHARTDLDARHASGAASAAPDARRQD